MKAKKIKEQVKEIFRFRVRARSVWTQLYTERQYQPYVHTDALDQSGVATNFGVTRLVY